LRDEHFLKHELVACATRQGRELELGRSSTEMTHDALAGRPWMRELLHRDNDLFIDSATLLSTQTP
jgi:hypothetical protein